MKALLEMFEISDMNRLEEQVNLAEWDLSNLLRRRHAAQARREPTIGNDPIDPNDADDVRNYDVDMNVPDHDATPDLNAELEEAIKRLQAARRGLGIANKFSRAEDRKKNRSRIMGNLNRIAAIVRSVEKQLADYEQQSPRKMVGLKQAARDMGHANSELNRPAFESVSEDVEDGKDNTKLGKLKKAVKGEKVAQKELEKNPFNKNKKVKSKK